jgi:hypothetical protein
VAREWYLKLEDEELGPLTGGELKAMAREGKISPYTPVRRGEGADWVPANRVRGLLPETGSPERKAGAPIRRAKPLEEPPGDVPSAEFPKVTPGAEAPGPSPSGQSGSDTPDPRPRLVRLALFVMVAVVVLSAIGTAIFLWKSEKELTIGAVFFFRQEKKDAAADGTPAQEGSEPPEIVVEGLAEFLGRPEPQVEASPEPSDAGEWTDASKSAIERGNVSVKIASARVARPKLVQRASDRTARPRRLYLVIRLELCNNDQTKGREYQSWSVLGDDVRLVDDRDNAYAMKSFLSQGFEIDGQPADGKMVLEPEVVASDLLLFERPTGDASPLRLELPAGALGEEGSLKFEIPVSMFAKAAKPADKAAGAEPDELSADAEEAMAAMEEGGPIAIPGLPLEDEDDDEDDFSFADDPKLQKARRDLRRQSQRDARPDRAEPRAEER